MIELRYAHIETAQNGYVVTTGSGTFVFTSFNAAIKKIKEIMAPEAE